MDVAGTSGADPQIWSAPATSANLGSGFDALALALDLRLTVSSSDDLGARPPQGAAHMKSVTDSHPAAVAYRAAGGQRKYIAVGGPVPPGRGLGYSAAARVAGAACALAELGNEGGHVRDQAYEIAVTLEGHRDNAAAATYGGIVIAAEHGVIRVPFPNDLEVLVWVPVEESSTRRSRAQLPADVPFGVAVAAVARVATLIAALASGELTNLPLARGDELHEPERFERLPASREIQTMFHDAGAPFAYLSGSGPTVAALGSKTELEACMQRLGGVPLGELHLNPISIQGLVAELRHDL
ncbi:MAG: homoserine kinase [Acidimicrobiia bacterium]